MKDEVDVVGLIFIGEIAPVERAKLTVDEFWGHEADVEALKADNKTAVKAIVDREWEDVHWDGVSSLRMAVIERLKQICRRNKAESLLLVKERNLEAARKVLANHRANGGLSRTVVEAAEKVISQAAE